MGHIIAGFALLIGSGVLGAVLDSHGVHGSPMYWSIGAMGGGIGMIVACYGIING